MILSFEWGSAGWLFCWSDLGSCMQVLSSGVSNWAGTSRMTSFTCTNLSWDSWNNWELVGHFSLSPSLSKQNRWISWHGDPWPLKAQKQKLPAPLKAHAWNSHSANSVVFHWLKHITFQPRLKKKKQILHLHIRSGKETLAVFNPPQTTIMWSGLVG